MIKEFIIVSVICFCIIAFVVGLIVGYYWRYDANKVGRLYLITESDGRLAVCAEFDDDPITFSNKSGVALDVVYTDTRK